MRMGESAFVHALKTNKIDSVSSDQLRMGIVNARETPFKYVMFLNKQTLKYA